MGNIREKLPVREKKLKLASRDKKTCDQLTIGSKVYLVNRDYAFKKGKWSGEILLGKVRTFRNVRGSVVPLFREIGNGKRGDLSIERYVPFVTVQDAIDAIKN